MSSERDGNNYKQFETDFMTLTDVCMYGRLQTFSRGGGKNILFAYTTPKNTLRFQKKVKNITFCPCLPLRTPIYSCL